MKIAFYCRVDGQGFGFVLPDEADKLREFSPSIRISLRLKIHQAQAKNFCRVLDIRVSHVMKTNVFCSNLLDDPVVQPAESVWIPCLPGTR